MPGLAFVWLEITGRCQLFCEHCYAESGPSGSHGSMTAADWRRVIGEAADLGVPTVQFIGGEPTLHPDLPSLVSAAVERGLQVEVFSNLVHVSDRLWEVFSLPGVRLATSYYSDRADQHEAITGRRGSLARTTANIAESVRRGIPLRVGIIDVRDGQRVRQATERLTALGVTDIGHDRLRQVGRGVRDQAPSVAQLCGKCAGPVLAIGPDGQVWPCVFSRWMPVGNVRSASLGHIVRGPAVAAVRASLSAEMAAKAACQPLCAPECWPTCRPGCNPMCLPEAPRALGVAADGAVGAGSP